MPYQRMASGSLGISRLKACILCIKGKFCSCFCCLFQHPALCRVVVIPIGAPGIISPLDNSGIICRIISFQCQHQIVQRGHNAECAIILFQKGKALGKGTIGLTCANLGSISIIPAIYISIHFCSAFIIDLHRFSSSQVRDGIFPVPFVLQHPPLLCAGTFRGGRQIAFCICHQGLSAGGRQDSVYAIRQLPFHRLIFHRITDICIGQGIPAQLIQAVACTAFDINAVCIIHHPFHIWHFQASAIHIMIVHLGINRTPASPGCAANGWLPNAFPIPALPPFIRGGSHFFSQAVVFCNIFCGFHKTIVRKPI